MKVIWIETSSDMLFPPPRGGESKHEAPRDESNNLTPPPSLAVVALL